MDFVRAFSGSLSSYAVDVLGDSWKRGSGNVAHWLLFPKSSGLNSIVLHKNIFLFWNVHLPIREHLVIRTLTIIISIISLKMCFHWYRQIDYYFWIPRLSLFIIKWLAQKAWKCYYSTRKKLEPMKQTKNTSPNLKKITPVYVYRLMAVEMLDIQDVKNIRLLI